MDDLLLVPDPDGAGAGAVADLEEALVLRRHLGEEGEPGRAREAATEAVASVLPRARRLLVRRGEVVLGHVWLVRGEEGEDLSLLDLRLPDSRLAPRVRDEMVRLARSGGHRRLTLAVPPGDPVLLAFAKGGGFRETSAQMALALPVETGRAASLRPMSEVEFDRWHAVQLETYTAERVRAGESPEQAAAVVRRQDAELLPQGHRTPRQHLFTAVVDGVDVGTLWLSTRRPMVWVCDVVVAVQHRRRGHGAALMRAAAAWSSEHGAHAIGLNVFADNHGARALYDRLGFHVTEAFAALDLGVGR